MSETANTILSLITGIMVGYTIYECRIIWITRRQPVRKDAPTGREPWIHPEFWR